ncbi:helix-turn-helix domain-containing protein [Lutimonas sp.]|uniref:helix-turn-helix domain-containing protein n=1 Tax=Lutimonas sp. TaxID=1872403 RepID=UPI003D9BE6DE
MINNSEFSNRLRTIMEFYQLSASGFADRIQVPRSSISHLLSGRNKPSLDFVLKVVKVFDEVELYWLLNGKGNFPNNTSPDQIIEQKTIQPKKEPIENNPVTTSLASSAHTSKKIERIVLFFEDGTFKEYIQ